LRTPERGREELPLHPVGFAQQLERFGEQAGSDIARWHVGGSVVVGGESL
jgi:hypothetical protein